MTDSPLAAGKFPRWIVPLLAALAALWAGPATVLPQEDAAILFRYADHIRQGAGMVWNIGDVPADGATDLLYLWGIAGLASLGLKLKAASLVLNIGAAGLILCLADREARRYALPPALSWLMLWCLSAGIWWLHAWAGFGSMFFAASLFLTGLCARRWAGEGAGWSASGWLALSALAAGLARPEGLPLSVALIALHIPLIPAQLRRQRLVSLATLYVPVAAGLLIWRTLYFGHLLPLPFHKRSGGGLHFDHFISAGLNVMVMGAALWLPIFLAFRRNARALMPILLFSLFFCLLWLLVGNEVNYFMRYQYALIPVMWLLLIPLIRVPETRNLSLFAGAALGLHIALQGWFVARHSNEIVFASDPPDGRYMAALAMRKVMPQGRLLTTEAGLLPLYSGWETLDALGLNDYQTAREGLTENRMADFHPDVIMIHGPDSLAGESTETRMARFAESKRYLQMRNCIPDGDCHYYYIRRDWIDAYKLGMALRQISYWRPYFRAYGEWSGSAWMRPEPNPGLRDPEQ